LLCAVRQQVAERNMAKDLAKDMIADEQQGASPPDAAAPKTEVRRRGNWIARFKVDDDTQVRSRASLNWFSKAKRDTFLEALAGNLNITLSAKAAGVNRNTITNWRKYNAEFRQQVAEVMAEAYLDAEAKMLAMAIGGVQHSTTVEKVDDRLTTTKFEGDDPQLTLHVMRLHRATVTAREAADEQRLVLARRPSNNQLAQWLHDDLTAIEAEQNGGGGQWGDDADQ
jgi:hypothetical protein